MKMSRIEESMIKRLLTTAVMGVVVASITFADQTSKIVIPATRTAPNDGQQMFTSYCAPCHGVNGKGQGPAAAALPTRPSDLTTLARNHHGKYPDTHIVAVLEFGTQTQAHTSMPVWGPILGQMNRTNLQDKQLRISNLARYLETIQER